ncbi:DEAD/DEAH box helicase family protein, partial [bacterium]|nr:DEAD/DEAH box helicase family protein [bacterium]
MPNRTSITGSELFIVDNSHEDWKVLRYLRDWCPISRGLDIATGYFEIGSLLALQDEWQKVDHIRILMGDEYSQRTRQTFEQGLAENIKQKLDQSLESEKEKNAFLTGVEAVTEAIHSGKIRCRVYRKDKFHAKAYITHARMDVVGSSALVGSSNFTLPGITENIELNVRITGTPVKVLQEWYEEHWNEAEDITSEVLQTIERHTINHTPFDVYAKALQAYFREHEMTVTEWERRASKIYPILSPYQQEGYHGLIKRAAQYNGAFLCDGVGLGKTFIGLMLIERLVMHDKKNVALFVPKAAREDVWEREIKDRLPHVFGPYSKLQVFNHTDLMRGGNFQEKLQSVYERADVIIIDEAHHFRNTGLKGENPDEKKSRYWKLYEIIADKSVYMLTATPVNNRLTDLQHMMELFTRQQKEYFQALGIYSLTGHFRSMEKELENIIRDKQTNGEILDTNEQEAEQVLGHDELFKALVVQRSRAYVKKSLEQEHNCNIHFPKASIPKVVPYSIKKTYGRLLNMLEDSFSKSKPLFSLPIYYPYAYYQGDDQSIDPLAEGRQKQVVSLIRIQFLKRFESSIKAFEMSCQNLLRKLLAWLKVHAEGEHEKGLIERWKSQHNELIRYGDNHKPELSGEEDDQDDDEDIVTDEMLEDRKKLSRQNFKVEEIIAETLLDMSQIADFLKELKGFNPAQDKKLTALIHLLKNDAVLKQEKVLIFTEFKDTARYLKEELIKAGITGIEEIDSSVKGDRSKVIRRFAPYYNGSSSAQLIKEGLKEIRILISTDVLSEGLNLQDATRLINYDLHWNPVRLMQRIGRIDRRMQDTAEDRLLADHPEQKALRGEVAYWNFLPPDELDEMLKLYQTVSNKTLRISKTFGIEGRKLLKPDDNYDDVREF